MSARREPSTPPVIPGYEYSRLLGMGGFADVFLYEQQMPRRAVAVKVLLASSLGDEVRARFRQEADVMAQLSHHPSIVTIYQADVARDGRPYLIMEYCARPGLGQRYRTERMGVAEVLRIGIRLASAVETAHRAGVLHRDIKPANVLITDFGWPALTDFGIAATTGWSSGSAVGMSIPWSPPELLAAEPAGDVRADVYSLAATIYSLLARRSPFEVPDGPNSAADLIARIERSALTPTGRGDVPDSLHEVLARAMDRVPERRPHSALALARALQQVEAQMMLPLTPLDLPEDVVEQAAGGRGELAAEADDNPERDQATRLRPVPSVSPAAPAAPSSTSSTAPSGTPPGAVPPEHGAPADTDDDVLAAWRRQAERLGGATPEPTTVRRGPGRLVAGLAGLVVVGALGGAALLAFGPDADEAVTDPGPTPTPTASPSTPVRAVPAPSDLEASLTEDGRAVFTWQNPEPQDGDRYLWGAVVPGTEPTLEIVEEATVTVDAGDDPTCIEVSIVRTDGRYSSEPAVGCAQA